MQELHDELVMLFHFQNEAAAAFYKDTQEKVLQQEKFEACFDNVNESIILLS